MSFNCKYDPAYIKSGFISGYENGPQRLRVIHYWVLAQKKFEKGWNSGL